MLYKKYWLCDNVPVSTSKDRKSFFKNFAANLLTTERRRERSVSKTEASQMRV